MSGVQEKIMSLFKMENFYKPALVNVRVCVKECKGITKTKK